MADLVESLATHTGIPAETVQKGVASLMSFLKAQLGDETFSKLESSVPGVSGMADQSQAAPAAPQGGLLGTITALAGKLLGSQGAGGADLVSALSGHGFQPEHIEAFLPKALELIKQHVPPEVLEKVVASLPALRGVGQSEAKPQ